MNKKKMNKTILNIFLLSATCVLIFFGVTYFFGNYAGAFQTKVWVGSEKEVEFNEEVVLNFSDSIVTSNFTNHINIEPKVEVDYIWENFNKVLKISPRSGWALGEEYIVEINNLKSVFLVGVNEKINFFTTPYPRVVDFYPKDGVKDVVIDIEGPGVITFDKPLSNFNLKVKVSPDKKLIYNLNEEKNIVHFAFKESYEKGQQYQVILYIKHKEENKGGYREIYRSSFQSESLPSSEWDKDFSKRLDQARKFTEAKVQEGKYIDINLGVQVMTIFENGEVIDSFLISSGKRGMDTPKGEFKVSNKHPRPWSRKYGLYMPYWMAIVPSGKFGIHELPEWPGGYKEGQNHLGTPVSHGCVRLGVGAAERVYNWAEIGTPIVIY